MDTNLREERTELVFLLGSLLEQQKISHRPAMFVDAIRQTRRKVLGIYTSILNSRKPKDTLLPISEV